MHTVTQKIKFRQSLIHYSEKYGVTRAAIKYNVTRQYIYFWKRRYDGSLHSLEDRSHRPKYHPNQHTHDEIKLIKDMRRRNPHDGLVVFWVKLQLRGYTRSISGLYRMLIKLKQPRHTPPNPKYIPKPYEKMHYPGQRVQVDVKVVPTACIVGDAKGQKFYQYTAIDEYSRFRYIEAFREQSTYSSKVFLEHMLKAFPFAVACVQTDNGFEFTKKFGKSKKPKDLTLFEAYLEEKGIKHKLIRPYTPRHNGKVERSPRKDNEYFYATHSFYSFKDFEKQLAVHSRKYNHFPMRPLHWKSPCQIIDHFLATGEVDVI